MRRDDVNNNDNRRLNEKIYINDHNDEIRMKFYWFIVNNFLDENLSCIYRIEIEKIAIISKFNRNEFRICNKKIIEYSRLVEWQANLRLLFDKRIFEKRNFFDSKISWQKFQITWRNFVFDNDNVKSSNNNFKNKSINNSLKRKFDWFDWRDFDITRLSLSSILCRWKIENYYCVDNVLYILWQFCNVIVICFAKNFENENDNNDFSKYRKKFEWENQRELKKNCEKISKTRKIITNDDNEQTSTTKYLREIVKSLLQKNARYCLTKKFLQRNEKKTMRNKYVIEMTTTNVIQNSYFLMQNSNWLTNCDLLIVKLTIK